MAKRRKKRKKARRPFALKATRFETQNSILYDWILRISAILYMFHVFYQDINVKNIEFTGSMFIDGFVNVIRLIVFLLLIVVIIVLKKTALRFVTFFLAMIFSVIKIVFDFINIGFNSFAFAYLLIIVIVAYYLPKYRDSLKRSN